MHVKPKSPQEPLKQHNTGALSTLFDKPNAYYLHCIFFCSSPQCHRLNVKCLLFSKFLSVLVFKLSQFFFYKQCMFSVSPATSHCLISWCLPSLSHRPSVRVALFQTFPACTCLLLFLQDRTLSTTAVPIT